MTYSQVIPYMTSLGFSESQRSWIFTTSAIIGMAVQLFVGYLSDKNQKMKIYFIWSMVFLLIFSAISYSSLPNAYALYFITISSFVALFRVGSNLAETWTYQINEEVMSKFGLIRVFGSIGWAVGSYVVAEFISQQGYNALPLWIIVLSIIVLLLSFGIVDAQKISNPSSLKLSDVNELFKNKQFALSVVVYFVFFFVYTMEGLTLIDKMIEINATSQQIGNLWAFQAIVELPLMVYGIKLIEKMGIKKILVITAIAYFIRYGLYGLATEGNQIVLISGLQLITYPFMLLSQKVVINKTTPLHLRASGHMVMTGITSNIPIIIVPLLSALLHRFMSYSSMLIGAGILCLLTIGFIFKFQETAE